MNNFNETREYYFDYEHLSLDERKQLSNYLKSKLKNKKIYFIQHCFDKCDNIYLIEIDEKTYNRLISNNKDKELHKPMLFNFNEIPDNYIIKRCSFE